MKKSVLTSLALTLLILPSFAYAAHFSFHGGWLKFIGGMLRFSTPAAVVTACSPTDVSGLRFWVKADSLALSDGNPVSTWADQSGSGDDLTASGGSRPVYKTNIQNGKPVVRFDAASSQYLALTTPFYDTGGWTSFVVMKRTSGSMIALSNDAGSDPYTVYMYFGDSRTYISNRANGASLPENNTNFTLWTSENTSGDVLSLWKNGSAQSLQSPFSLSNSNNFDVVGRRTSDYSTGDIGEILVYNRALSDPERSSVESCLSTKWGL